MVLAMKGANDKPSHIDTHMHHAPSVPYGVCLKVPSIMDFDACIERGCGQENHQEVYDEEGFNSLSFVFHILCSLMMILRQR